MTLHNIRKNITFHHLWRQTAYLFGYPVVNSGNHPSSEDFLGYVPAGLIHTAIWLVNRIWVDIKLQRLIHSSSYYASITKNALVRGECIRLWDYSVMGTEFKDFNYRDKGNNFVPEYIPHYPGSFPQRLRSQPKRRKFTVESHNANNNRSMVNLSVAKTT